MKKQVYEVRQKGKHRCISPYFAASTVGWLRLEHAVRHFQSLIKNVLPTLPVLRTLSSLPLPFPILQPLSYPPIPAFPYGLPPLAPCYLPPPASPTLPPPSQLWRRLRQPVPARRRHLAGGRPDREADRGGAAPRGGGGAEGGGRGRRLLRRRCSKLQVGSTFFFESL